MARAIGIRNCIAILLSGILLIAIDTIGSGAQHTVSRFKRIVLREEEPASEWVPVARTLFSHLPLSAKENIVQTGCIIERRPIASVQLDASYVRSTANVFSPPLRMTFAEGVEQLDCLTVLFVEGRGAAMNLYSTALQVDDPISNLVVGSPPPGLDLFALDLRGYKGKSFDSYSRAKRDPICDLSYAHLEFLRNPRSS